MPKKIAVISVAPTGYRRAGLELAQGKNEFEADALTDAQLAALKADPRLTVMELADEPAQEPANDKEPAKGKSKGGTDAPKGEGQ